MSAEPLVVLDAVTKRYETTAGVVDALAPITAEVPRSAVTAVVGVSGSGKSTLLRLIAGHELATSGHVLVAGRDLARLGPRALNALLQHDVTFVAQRAADNLFPHLTLAEHLRPSSPRSAFDVLGLGDRLGALASELSGGELARAAFAVSLSRGAGLVVVDEPTAELDSETAALVLTAMSSAAVEGATFVVATHDPEVLAIADAVIDLTRRRPAPSRTYARPHVRDEVALRARRLTKRYDGVVALADADLELRSGELGVVVGRSGSGKSTLLMLLGGWLEPDTGTTEPHSRDWQHLAYVPQRFGLVPELTVAENVDLPARFHPAAPPPGDLLDRLGIAELGARLPAEISIGQQQRVAIARALRLAPRILIVDEPTSHQDPAHAERVWAELESAAADGTACLVATHEPDATERADASWHIEDGRLTPSG